MENINWNYPTPIWFGQGRINEIQKACDNLNISKPLIVTDPGILKTDIVEKINSNLIISILKPIEAGLNKEIFLKRLENDIYSELDLLN